MDWTQETEETVEDMPMQPPSVIEGDDKYRRLLIASRKREFERRTEGKRLHREIQYRLLDSMVEHPGLDLGVVHSCHPGTPEEKKDWRLKTNAYRSTGGDELLQKRLYGATQEERHAWICGASTIEGESYTDFISRAVKALEETGGRDPKVKGVRKVANIPLYLIQTHVSGLVCNVIRLDEVSGRLWRDDRARAYVSFSLPANGVLSTPFLSSGTVTLRKRARLYPQTSGPGIRGRSIVFWERDLFESRPILARLLAAQDYDWDGKPYMPRTKTPIDVPYNKSYRDQRIAGRTAHPASITPEDGDVDGHAVRIHLSKCSWCEHPVQVHMGGHSGHQLRQGRREPVSVEEVECPRCRSRDSRV